MDDRQRSGIIFYNDTDVLTIGVERQIAGLRTIPRYNVAIAVLAFSAAAVTNNVLASAGIIEYPVDKSGAIQPERTHSTGRGASVRPHLRRRPPAAVPPKHERLATPKVIDLAQQRVSRQHDFFSFLAQIGGERFHNIGDLFRRKRYVLVSFRSTA